MPFDANQFPVPLSPENETTFSVGNLVNVPANAGTCLLTRGRVTKVVKYKRMMLVTIEEIEDETGS